MAKAVVSLVGVAILIGVVVTAMAPPSKKEPQTIRPTASEFVHPKGYVCYRATDPIVVDGKLDDSAWKQASWSDAFVDIEGDRKPHPQLATNMKMLWDDRYLYIAVEIEEPHVWGTLTQHDSVIFHDNDFEVFIDPDGDNHLYAELEINALNTIWELLLTKPYKDGGKAIDAWDIPGLATAVHVNGTINDPKDQDRGWSIEIAWPWKSFNELMSQKLPPKDGDQWRINFSRVEWDIRIDGGKYVKIPKTPEHNWVWSPQGVVDMHRPEKWGYVQFSTREAGIVAFRADPSAAARDKLHRIYYAQRDHQKKTGKFASRVDELDPNLARTLGSGVVLRSRSDRDFDAFADYWEGSNRKRLRIGSDSRIRLD